MNKEQKEILQSQLNNEKKTINELKQVYGQALKDVNQKIRELSSRTDMENLQSVIYQKRYQEALNVQLEGVLANLQSNEYATISDYLERCYKDGFAGVAYELKSMGIPMIIPIDQSQVVKAIQTDSKISKGLYSRLGEDVNNLKTSIRAELSRGIANGSTWNEIATRLSRHMKTSGLQKALNNSIRIARTEGHRVQVSAAMDFQSSAKENGADVVKQWDATLDGNTRPTHRELDGKLAEIDEDFEYSGGSVSAPGNFGDPAEDCNCRCALLTRARWALDQDELNTLKERAKYFGLDKTKGFDDFKEKYLKSIEESDDVQEYLKAQEKYSKSLSKLDSLKKETDDLLDKYMDAIDTENEKTLENLHSQKYDELESFREIVKDLKAQLSGKEAKAVRQVEKQLASKTGITLNKVKMTGMPFDSANTVYNSYKKVMKKFPELKDNMSGFSYETTKKGKAYASCEALTGNIRAYSIFGDFKKLANEYSSDVKIGFHPVGTDYNSIIVHELGHALDGYMTKKGLLGGKINKYGVIRSSIDVQNQVLYEIGWDVERINNIKTSLKRQGYSHSEIMDEIKNQKKEFIKEKVSGYAAESEKEFFAECFSEYIMSDNPREAAQIFGKIVEEALGR